MNTNATAESGASPAIVRQTDSYVIAIMNQKGGVGKTMVALALAAHTAAANGRALLVDVDPQANAYDISQAFPEPGYDVIHELQPADLTRIRGLREFDTILVDCPGSLEGQDVLAEVLARSTYVIIPYDHSPESILPTIRTAAESGNPGRRTLPLSPVPTRVWALTSFSTPGGHSKVKASSTSEQRSAGTGHGPTAFWPASRLPGGMSVTLRVFARTSGVFTPSSCSTWPVSHQQGGRDAGPATRHGRVPARTARPCGRRAGRNPTPISPGLR